MSRYAHACSVKEKTLAFPLRDIAFLERSADLFALPFDQKIIISCLNAHSHNMAQVDARFANALRRSLLLADGSSICMALRMLHKRQPERQPERVTGHHLFVTGMDLLNRMGGTAFFLGTNDETIKKIRERVRKEYPNVRTAGFAPPYKKEFSEADTLQMIAAMERHQPDILWIGLGAPKQEKWAAENLDRLPVKGWIGCIGAVFDFYSGHIARAPWVWQKYHSEWLHRFLHDPGRLWKRYLLGNAKFIGNVLRERGEG